MDYYMVVSTATPLTAFAALTVCVHAMVAVWLTRRELRLQLDNGALDAAETMLTISDGSTQLRDLAFDDAVTCLTHCDEYNDVSPFRWSDHPYTMQPRPSAGQVHTGTDASMSCMYCCEQLQEAVLVPNQEPPSVMGPLPDLDYMLQLGEAMNCVQ